LRTPRLLYVHKVDYIIFRVHRKNYFLKQHGFFGEIDQYLKEISF
jgi:hypothetical protein